MVYTEVSREFGCRWSQVDLTVKSVLKCQAAEFNVALAKGTEDDVEIDVELAVDNGNVTESESHLLNAGPSNREVFDAVIDLIAESDVPEVLVNMATEDIFDDVIDMINDDDDVDQIEAGPSSKKRRTAIKDVEELTDCPICELSYNTTHQLSKHMQEDHVVIQANLVQCHECGKLFFEQSKLQEHIGAKHEERSTVEIVLVKLRTLSWPAEVVNRKDGIIEVKMIHDGSKKNVNAIDVSDFDVSKISNTKNPKLKVAFAKAAEIMKKNS